MWPDVSEYEKTYPTGFKHKVTNIDDNVGKVLTKLEELKIADNTLVIFMTDNGPQQRRYNAGMRGLKSSVYRGGVRVPFYWRFPVLFEGEITNSVHLKNPQRIIIGSEYENPVYLNRNDALGTRGIWTQAEIYGFWKVKVLEGWYNIRFGFIEPPEKNGRMFLETNSVIIRSEINNTSSGIIQLEDIYLSEMECDLTPYYSIGGKNIFPLWVELEKLEDE